MKKILLLILSVSLFSFNSHELNAMKRWWGREEAKPAAAKRGCSDPITVAIKETFAVFGEELKTKTQEGFYESFQRTREQITHDQISEQLLAIIDRIIKESIIGIIFGKIDQFAAEISTNESISQNNIKRIVAQYILGKTADLRRKLEEKIAGTEQKNIAQMLLDLITTKAEEGLEKQKEVDYAQEMTVFLQKHAEPIKTTTSAIGYSLVILGELAPNLPEICQQISEVVSEQINELINEVGDIFAAKISEILPQKTIIQDPAILSQMINQIIDEAKQAISITIEQKIGAKIIEILDPHIQRIILSKVESVLPRGTQGAAAKVITALVKKYVTQAITNIKDKALEKIEVKKGKIAEELTPIIIQIVAES